MLSVFEYSCLEPGGKISPSDCTQPMTVVGATNPCASRTASPPAPDVPAIPNACCPGLPPPTPKPLRARFAKPPRAANAPQTGVPIAPRLEPGMSHNI